MKTKLRNAFLSVTAVVLALFLCAGIFAMNRGEAKADGELAKTCLGDTEVTGFGDISDDVQKQCLWFSVSENDYAGASSALVNATQINGLNTTNKIRISIDGEEKLLSEYSPINPYLNLWTRPGFAFQGSAIADYTAIERIVIEEGCEFPSFETCDSATEIKYYKTAKAVMFVNDGTGKFVTEPIKTCLGDVSVISFGDPGGVPASTDANARCRLFFVVSGADYASAPATTQLNANQVKKLNWTNKIKITVDSEEKTIESVYTPTETYFNIFARGTNIIALHYIPGDYTAIEKIVIEEGCEFPSFATYNSENEIKYYKTTKTVTFVNDGTGKFEIELTKTCLGDTEVTGFGDISDDVQKQCLWFGVSENDYDGASNALVNATQINGLNTTNKIKVLVGGEEKLLSEYSPINPYLNLWTRPGFAFQGSAIADYTAIERIVIEEGCEFPSFSTYNSEEEIKYYKTAKTVTFVNDGTGKFLTLESARKNAVDTISNYKLNVNFRDSEKARYNEIVDAATNAINACETYAETETIVENAKTKIDALKTAEQYEAEELAAALAEAKTAAKTEIEGYKNLEDYREAQKTELAGIIANGKTAIDECETVESVNAKVVEIKAMLDEVKTDAQLTEEEHAAALAEAKTAAKTEIEGYKNLEDYREAQKTELAGIIANGKTAIDECETVESVNAKVVEIKAMLDEVKTDAQLTDEEHTAALAEAKTAAKTEIEGYKNLEDYREAQKTELAGIIANGKTAIDECETVESVNAKVVEIKAMLDEVKTDAQLTDEEFSEYIESVKSKVDEFKRGIKVDEYTEENVLKISALTDECKTLLSSAKTKSEADKLYEDLVAAVNAVEKKQASEEVGGCFGTVESLAGILSLLSVAAIVVIKKKKSI